MIPEDESFEDRQASRNFFAGFSGRNINPFRRSDDDGLIPDKQIQNFNQVADDTHKTLQNFIQNIPAEPDEEIILDTDFQEYDFT
jgi:hypothetical protein